MEIPAFMTCIWILPKALPLATDKALALVAIFSNEAWSVLSRRAKWLAFMKLLAILSAVGCKANAVPSFTPNPNYSVYQTVLAHLSTSVKGSSKFVGPGFAVAPEFCEPGKNPFLWNSKLKIASDLKEAFERANLVYRPLDSSEFVLPFVKIREIESYHDLFYYREEIDTVDVKGFVQFWQAGFNETHDVALVRFFYGPSAHGAVGTYVLQNSGKGWTIKVSVIDYYL